MSRASSARYPTCASRAGLPRIPDSTSLELGTGDFLIEVVASWTNVSYGLIYGKAVYGVSPYNGAIVFAGYTSSTGFAAQTNISDHVLTNAMSLNDGTARLVGFQRAGTTLTTRVNGIADGTATVNPPDDCNAIANAADIGSQGRGVQQMLGDIAEIVVISGTVDATDLQALESYLQTKYAL